MRAICTQTLIKYYSMPCAACGKGRAKAPVFAPIEQLDMPDPAIWGPSLWTILHVAAERVGQNTIIPLRADEVRELEMLIKSFPVALPCATCQTHAGQYLAAHRFNWTGKSGVEARNIISRYLYDFHDHVNRNKATPAISPPYEDINIKYKAIGSITEEVAILNKEIIRAINFNIVKHDAAHKFRRHLSLLRGFIGI